MELNIQRVKLTLPQDSTSAGNANVRSLSDARTLDAANAAAKLLQQHIEQDDSFLQSRLDLTLNCGRQLSSSCVNNRSSEPGTVIVTNFPMQLPITSASGSHCENVQVDAEMRFEPATGEITFLHVEGSKKMTYLEYLKTNGHQYHMGHWRIPPCLIDFETEFTRVTNGTSRDTGLEECLFTVQTCVALHLKFMKDVNGQRTELQNVTEIADAVQQGSASIVLPDKRKINKGTLGWPINEIPVKNGDDLAKCLKMYRKRHMV